MKKHFLLIIAFILGTTIVNAQLPSGSYSSYFKEGSFLMLEENFDLALKNFLEAYKLDSSSANINFNVGYCYLHSATKKALAERYLAKAVTDISKNYRSDDPSEKSASPLALFDYGKALHINYKFDEAIAQYDNFVKNYVKDKGNKEEVEYYKMQSVYAKELVAAPINVTVQNMGDSINSEYPDFSPVMSADERMMIYTTRRNTSTGGEKTPDGQFFEDIVVAYKNEHGIWSAPKSISPFINTNGHDAAVFLTPDEQTLVTFRDDNGDGNVYYSNWDGKDWSSLQQFGSDVNTKYWETHACLSADKNTLYFVSDRPGGYGGRDIYRCVKLPNGAWSKALNVGPTINTKYDEDGPFIHPDGITLIFASRGHKSMGGFDIFVSIMEEDKKFSEPENMRCPINTPDDDVFFITSPDGKRGYFSSAKEGGFGEKDIYTMFIPDAKEKPLVLFKGSILPADGEKLPDELEIIVTNKETGEIVGKYRPKENGTFATILPPNKNYNFSYQAKGEEFYNEDIYVSDDLAYQEIKKEINLEPVSLLGKVKVKDKGIILNTIVLNNPKDKAFVANAKVTLTEKGGSDTNFSVDEKGKKDGTKLAVDKLYTIYAEANGKKSAVNSFNTVGIKGGKSITQVLYIDGKPAKTFDLFLNVSVVNKKRKALANANVTLTGNDGSKYTGTTDAKGRLKGIELQKDVNYDLIAEKDGNTSDKTLFTTMNVTAKKTYDKTLVIDAGTSSSNPSSSDPAEQAVTCETSLRYHHNFSYNANDPEEADDWNRLVNGLVTKSKECNTTVKILSSASQVPTRTYANNNELAQSRADKLEEKIKAAVTAKGGDVSKLTFTKVWAVRGPAYEADYQNTAKYTPYQYVKVICK
jgi:tetratricopeptide (TPR) repeat protein